MKQTCWVAFVGLFIAWAATADHPLCVDPDNPSCYSTIQAAVDAAKPGDTILVYPHSDPRGYREHVKIAKNDLTIKGVFEGDGPEFMSETGHANGRKGKGKKGGEDANLCPKQILDGCDTVVNPGACSEFNDHGFEINATGVTIRNFTIRHMSNAVKLISAHGATIKNICVFTTMNGVFPEYDNVSNNVTVADSRFRGIYNQQAVSIRGNDARVFGNELINTDGIWIGGDRGKVLNNTVEVTSDTACIETVGTGTLIENNSVLACGNACVISRGGGNAVIKKNSVGNCTDDGIRLHDGTGSKILGNRIAYISDDESGMDVRGDNIEIGYNVIEFTSNHGMEYEGNNSKIHHNTIKGSADGSSQSALEINGSDNLILKNVALSNTHSGIENNDGDRNKYIENLCIGNGKSGIRIRVGSNNVVKGNRTFKNHGEGINNTAENTVIIGNESFGNRTDICSNNPPATFEHNDYETGGPTTPCVVE